MKKQFFSLFLLLFIYVTADAQVTVAKRIGKNASRYSVGLGLFETWTFPLGETGNNSLVVELLDVVYFIGKPPLVPGNNRGASAYVSIKGGFRKVFSGESQTGFYAEPSIGFARVTAVAEEAFSTGPAPYKDGVALAFETGYSLDVGERGNTLTFGLKYENDVPGHALNIQSVAFRAGFNFLRSRRYSR